MKLKTLLFSLCLLFSLITSQAARIIVLADLHVLPGNECEAQLRLAVNEINQSNADAVVIDGDLTNEGSDEQLTNVKTILDLITKPQFMLPGNHETNWSQSATKTIFDEYRGQQITFPIHLFNAKRIQCIIIKEYDGSNIRELAKKYGYSEHLGIFENISIKVEN